jgi:hypothetical protein
MQLTINQSGSWRGEEEEGGGYEAGVAETLDDFGWEGLGGCSQGGGGGSGEATRRHVRVRRTLVMDVDKVRGEFSKWKLGVFGQRATQRSSMFTEISASRREYPAICRDKVPSNILGRLVYIHV